jgi:hypothetical protein
MVKPSQGCSPVRLYQTSRREIVQEMRSMKPKAQKQEAGRLTEDDIAQASLGGTRGSADLEPAKMTRRQKQDLPTEGGFDPGHTA